MGRYQHFGVVEIRPRLARYTKEARRKQRVGSGWTYRACCGSARREGPGTASGASRGPFCRVKTGTTRFTDTLIRSTGRARVSPSAAENAIARGRPTS